MQDAERRQLTVLFCDLVGSTALASRLDPEDWQEVIRTYQSACTTVVEDFGGVVAQYLGDGVLSYFGHPTAHEDDAERAVRTALRLIDVVPDLIVRLPGDRVQGLSVRVGIATGVVVTGYMAQPGAPAQQSAVGETPNLAARLQTLAEPDTVVISATTHDVLGGVFDYEWLGMCDIKGFEQPVSAWRVLRPRDAFSRFEAKHAREMSSLIGRDQELATLTSLGEQASGGHGGMVLISGDPGIGKSRLAVALRDRLAPLLRNRIRMQCSPYHVTSALHPFSAHLENAARIRHKESSQRKYQKLEKLLRMSGGRSIEYLPLLASLLHLSVDGAPVDLQLSPEQIKEQTLQSLIELFDGEVGS